MENLFPKAYKVKVNKRKGENKQDIKKWEKSIEKY